MGGIRLDRLIVVFIASTILISISLLATTFVMRECYVELIEVTNKYVALYQRVADMENASDFLSDQARAFVSSGDLKYVEGYFREVNEDKRREKALAEVKRQISYVRATQFLSQALADSKHLEVQEYTAMRLYMTAIGADLSPYASTIGRISLTPEEKDLTPEEQKARAQYLMYSPLYEQYKSRIRDDVDRSIREMEKDIQRDQKERETRLEHMRELQFILIVLTLLLTALLVGSLMLLILKPLRRILERIRLQQPAPLSGVRELQYVVSAYNQVLRENMDVRSQLTYDADHDSLTGVYNRRIFERNLLEYNSREQIMILADIDLFKQYNDQYGHETGDRVLRRVADTLLGCFDRDARICRIGGDEFAVILTDRTSGRKKVTRILDEVRGRLREDAEGHGPITLSIGIDLAGPDKPGEKAYSDADEALYRVKEDGRDGYAFSKESTCFHEIRK